MEVLESKKVKVNLKKEEKGNTKNSLKCIRKKAMNYQKRNLALFPFQLVLTMTPVVIVLVIIQQKKWHR